MRGHHCPACHSELRLEDDRLEVVRVTKPYEQERWVPLSERPGLAIAAVCYRRHVTPAELRSPSRRAPLVRVRQEAMRAAYEAGAGVSEIGRLLNRHHTTVIHALNKERTP